jgi:hypothetical protein
VGGDDAPLTASRAAMRGLVVQRLQMPVPSRARVVVGYQASLAAQAGHRFGSACQHRSTNAGT